MTTTEEIEDKKALIARLEKTVISRLDLSFQEIKFIKRELEQADMQLRRLIKKKERENNEYK